MAINLRFLITLLTISTVVILGVPPIKADWFYNDAKSQVAASLLAENMSDLK
jgi:hypothetical protein